MSAFVFWNKLNNTSWKKIWINSKWLGIYDSAPKLPFYSHFTLHPLLQTFLNVVRSQNDHMVMHMKKCLIWLQINVKHVWYDFCECLMNGLLCHNSPPPPPPLVLIFGADSLRDIFSLSVVPISVRWPFCETLKGS